MIHLDTNWLVGVTRDHSTLRRNLIELVGRGELFAASAIAWSEFLNGPIPNEKIQDALALVEERIVPFGASEAQLAASLFNRTGRRRGSAADCFIAATAICARAPLATENRKDFARFGPLGLRLI